MFSRLFLAQIHGINIKLGAEGLAALHVFSWQLNRSVDDRRDKSSLSFGGASL